MSIEIHEQIVRLNSEGKKLVKLTYIYFAAIVTVLVLLILNLKLICDFLEFEPSDRAILFVAMLSIVLFVSPHLYWEIKMKKFRPICPSCKKKILFGSTEKILKTGKCPHCSSSLLRINDARE